MLGRYRLQDLVDDMVPFLDRCIGEAAWVFGHSMGGLIGLMAAARCPARVRAVVVGDSPLKRRTRRARPH